MRPLGVSVSLLSVLLFACASPTAPTQSSGSVMTEPVGGAIQVPGSIPSADEPTAPVTTHLQDICTGGHLVYGDDGHGSPAYPITLSFTGPAGAHATATIGRDDGDNVTVTLPYGVWTVASVPASGTSDPNGYQVSGGRVTVPDENHLTINQRRTCFTPPPPTVPPPAPLPPAPPLPPNPVPPACEVVNLPSATVPTVAWIEGAPLDPSTIVANADTFTIELWAQDPVSGFQMIKTSNTTTLACGQTATLKLLAPYAWQTHPWREFWVVVHNHDGSIYKSTAHHIRPPL